MNEKYIHSEEDYESLKEALAKSNMLCFGRPDQFQYYQNELTKEVARFLLKPYLEEQKELDERKAK